MHAKTLAGVGLAVAAMVAVAGCTGGFNVRQTEPLKIQLDGAPQVVNVKETDTDPQRVLVENTDKVDSINIEVEVTRESEEAVTVLVTVQDSETNETLAQKTVEVGAANTTEPNQTPPNQTEPPDMTAPSETTTENIIVNVKGKNNVVVITEAQEGDATVNIAAQKGSAGTTTGGNTTAPTGPYGP